MGLKLKISKPATKAEPDSQNSEQDANPEIGALPDQPASSLDVQTAQTDIENEAKPEECGSAPDAQPDDTACPDIPELQGQDTEERPSSPRKDEAESGIPVADDKPATKKKFKLKLGKRKTETMPSSTAVNSENTDAVKSDDARNGSAGTAAPQDSQEFADTQSHDIASSAEEQRSELASVEQVPTDESSFAAGDTMVADPVVQDQSELVPGIGDESQGMDEDGDVSAVDPGMQEVADNEVQVQAMEEDSSEQNAVDVAASSRDAGELQYIHGQEGATDLAAAGEAVKPTADADEDELDSDDDGDGVLLEVVHSGDTSDSSSEEEDSSEDEDSEDDDEQQKANAASSSAHANQGEEGSSIKKLAQRPAKQKGAKSVGDGMRADVDRSKHASRRYALRSAILDEKFVGRCVKSSLPPGTIIKQNNVKLTNVLMSGVSKLFVGYMVEEAIRVRQGEKVAQLDRQVRQIARTVSNRTSAKDMTASEDIKIELTADEMAKVIELEQTRAGAANLSAPLKPKHIKQAFIQLTSKGKIPGFASHQFSHMNSGSIVPGGGLF